MQLPYLPQPGRPIDTAWAKQVIAYLKALTWQSTPSIKINTGSGGTTGRVILGKNTFQEILPFKIIFRVIDESLYAGIAPGILYKEINPSSTLAITGLLASSNPEATDPGWVAIRSDTKFWIEYTPPLDGSPASASIEHDQLTSTSSFNETGDAWTTSSVLEGDYGGDGLFRHETSRLMIGTIAYATREIDQTVTTDLMLQPFCILNRACHYFVPAWW